MTPEDIDRRSTRFFGKRILFAIIIVLVAGLAFGLWFFFISDSNNAIENNDNYLPPDCYSLNGKQICPKQ
ncbi:MAG: hypothetical protein WBN72_09360 [Nitrososphaeraceae archaeon]